MKENKVNEINQSKGKKKVYIIILIIAVIAIIALILVPRIIDMNQKTTLIQEVADLTNKTIGEDDFNTEIKTSGNYATVEETIKNYMQEYSDTVKSILDETKKVEDFSGTTEKSELEGKIQEINTIKTNLENEINKLVEMTDESYIESKIDEKNLSTKYTDLYKEIMISDLSSELKDIQIDMQSQKNRLTEWFDEVIRAYQYLLDNQDSWESNDGQILFYDYEKLDEYNSIVEGLQQKAQEITTQNE